MTPDDTNRDSDPGHTFDPGTEEDRTRLFEYLVDITLERDAFASLADHPCYEEHPAGIDIVEEMERYREELIEADTDEKLWFALRKISNARRDRHLTVKTVDGGLTLTADRDRRVKVPIRFAVDYGDSSEFDYEDPEGWCFFVGDLSTDIERVVEGPTPAVGDRLVAIRGCSVDEYVEEIRPYKRYSTEHALWWLIADEIGQTWDEYYGHGRHLPHSEFYGHSLESLALELERPDGSRYGIELPFIDPDEIDWQGHGDPTYPGFSPVDAGLEQFETIRDVYLPDNEDPSVILLDWYGFRRDLPETMDRLIEFAEENDLLDCHVIVDATRSRGGSRGSYALQRLQPQPHRGTFGNLKVSDAMAEWVADRIEGIESGKANPATVDDGTWQREWLETDVQRAIENDRRYTNDVPFKGAHAPKWSDGSIDPAPTHFRGGLTIWVGPHGGSHLDQFAAQVVDNNVGWMMGMPAGGYSSTWSYTETLRFPTTGAPIVEYQWSMGRSIRPNGETLQYNPAQPHECVPQRRDNYRDYHAELLERTFERLGIELPANR